MVGTVGHKKISSMGGVATLNKYGVDHFSLIGKSGVKAKFAKMTDVERKEYFKRLSAAGIAARKAKKEALEASKIT